MPNKKTYNRKYKCKYCDYKGTKEDLIKHIEKEHSEYINDEYTAARIVYNIINNREYGNCKVCNRPTKWNEEKYRYEAFCSIACRKKFKELIDKRMINKYGKTTLLNDPAHQEKMLQNRKISGKYTFEDGGEHSYCGGYEKQLLEFMDKTMGIKSDEITTPGPVFEYEFKGVKHYFISDLYYIPFNLVFDVKPGGKNPNTNEAMTEYNAKQKAKEDMIRKLDQYNYIRLTDNDFSQLLYIMNEIKINKMEEKNVKSIHINESSILNEIDLTNGKNEILPKDKDKKFIYLVLSHDDSQIGEALAMHGNKYTHCSISLNKELTEMYTFLITGLVEENKERYLKFSDHVNVVIYAVPLTDTQYNKLNSNIKSIKDNKDKYRYNFAGVISSLKGKAIKDDYKYFCSEFVDYILKRSNVYISKKEPSLTMPDDYDYDNNLSYKVYEGDLRNYNVKTIDESSILNEIDLTNEKNEILPKEYNPKSINSLLEANIEDDQYIVEYSSLNFVIEGIGVTDSLDLDLIKLENSNEIVDFDFIKNKNYNIYKYINENKVLIYSSDETDTTSYKDRYYKEINEAYDITFKKFDSKYIDTTLPILNPKIINEINNKLISLDLIGKITILEDMNGYYIYNIKNKVRSKSYKSLNEISGESILTIYNLTI